MKKLALVAAVLCLALWSVPAFAIDDTPLDGQAISSGADVVIDLAGYASGSPRYFTPNEAWGNQSIQVKMPLDATVPCYLELTFQGNDANKTMQSWGPDAQITTDANSNFIAFHPEVGGYLNGWTLYADSHDNNFEAPMDGTSYIRACDTFVATLWSNMNYKYSVAVKNGGLTGGLDTTKVLPVQMRYAAVDTTGADVALAAVADSAWQPTHDFSVAGAEKVILNGDNFLKETTVFQQFRVPFNKNFSAGHYTGEIAFTAATI